MNFTYWVSTPLYSSNGIDSYYMRNLEDKSYPDYWLAVYYFLIFSGCLAVFILVFICYKDFDQPTAFEKRRYAL